jgi:pentose-5-phosphate-3-epimerase
VQPERSVRPWIADASASGSGLVLLPEVPLECSANTVQSEKLILILSAQPPFIGE